MNDSDEIAGQTWADMVRALALLRTDVGRVDRLVERCLSSPSHPELAMALIETRHSAQRMLVTLAEARQLLADRLPGSAQGSAAPQILPSTTEVRV